MNAWKPGDVAYVTLTDGTSCPAVRSDDGDRWVIEPTSLPRRRVTDARPLVVIDPEDREAVGRLRDLAARHKHLGCGSGSCATDQFAVALREFANPTPPKPDEPLGLGAVVEDAAGVLWVRVGVTIGDMHWRSTEPGNTNCFKWRAVKAVRVLSEGVQS